MSHLSDQNSVNKRGGHRLSFFAVGALGFQYLLSPQLSGQIDPLSLRSLILSSPVSRVEPNDTTAKDCGPLFKYLLLCASQNWLPIFKEKKNCEKAQKLDLGLFCCSESICVVTHRGELD
jgi:hypothetical protein